MSPSKALAKRLRENWQEWKILRWSYDATGETIPNTYSCRHLPSGIDFKIEWRVFNRYTHIKGDIPSALGIVGFWRVKRAVLHCLAKKIESSGEDLLCPHCGLKVFE